MIERPAHTLHPDSTRKLVLADAGVEHAVEDVGEEVEEHHDDAAHHQAGKHDVDVLGLDPPCTKSSPMPCQENTTSTTKTPPRIAATSIATTVTSGTRALRRACRTVTLHLGRPLALAMRR